jgi:tripartite-type tricarboxylate transporter receptor subunit TctC
VTTPNVLVVHPALPVKSVTDLIALAKQKPGALNYATSGAGNSTTSRASYSRRWRALTHGAGELQRGGRLRGATVLSGRVEVMFATAAAAASHVSTGRLRALAVTSAQPSAVTPGLPTVAASGLPGYESGSTLGVFAPAATPAAIVNLLNREIVQFLNVLSTRERLLKAGIEVVGSSPAQFAAAIKSDMARIGKIIRDAGIRTD